MVDSDDWENDIDDALADEPKKEEKKVEVKATAAAVDTKFANEDDIDSEEEEKKRKLAQKET